MNTNHKTRQQAIEKLVDGELSIDEERQLLASFDRGSSGWKELAQTFLEDRILKDALSANAQFGEPVVDRQNSDGKPQKRYRMLLKVVSVAALVIVSFYSGKYSIIAPEQPSSTRIVETQHESEPDSNERRLPPAIEFVRLSLEDAGETVSQIEIPLIPWEQAVATYSAQIVPDSEPLIPEDVRKILARNGQTVEEQITYVPFEMPDGRTGIIPVSNIELRSNRYPEIQ